MDKVVVTITGATCSGKTTLERALVKTFEFERVISHTTRAPRQGEVHGVDYYFISKEEFNQMKTDKEFAETTIHSGNLYGASLAEFGRVWAKGSHVVIVVDPDGANQIQAMEGHGVGKVVSLFMRTDKEIREARLLDRFYNEKLYAATHDDPKPAEAYFKRLRYMQDHENHWPVSVHARMVVENYGQTNEGQVTLAVKALANLPFKRGTVYI